MKLPTPAIHQLQRLEQQVLMGADSMRQLLSRMPSRRLSVQIAQSEAPSSGGLTMISTTAGSSSADRMAGPSSARSLRAQRCRLSSTRSCSVATSSPLKHLCSPTVFYAQPDGCVRRSEQELYQASLNEYSEGMSATPRQPQVRETEDLQVEHPHLGGSRPAGILIGGRSGTRCECEARDHGCKHDRDEVGQVRVE